MSKSSWEIIGFILGGLIYAYSSQLMGLIIMGTIVYCWMTDDSNRNK